MFPLLRRHNSVPALIFFFKKEAATHVMEWNWLAAVDVRAAWDDDS
jgi:hypothetical protein